MDPNTAGAAAQCPYAHENFKVLMHQGRLILHQKSLIETLWGRTNALEHSNTFLAEKLSQSMYRADALEISIAQLQATVAQLQATVAELQKSAALEKSA